MAAHIFRSELASESASMAGMDGAGVIGDLIGITATQFITTTGITREATRFTTAAVITGEGRGAIFAAAATQATGLQTGISAVAEGTAAEPPGPSTEIIALLVDTLNPAVKAACAPAPSAVTTVADRPGAFHHAAAPASVAEGCVAAVDLAAGAGAGITNRKIVIHPALGEI
jgi:hypothetical protein